MLAKREVGVQAEWLIRAFSCKPVAVRLFAHTFLKLHGRRTRLNHGPGLFNGLRTSSVTL